MGIYSNYENIYGVNIFHYDKNDNQISIYEKQYQNTIDINEINILIDMINKIKETDYIIKYSVYIYTDCSSSHEINNNQKLFKNWIPSTLEFLYNKLICYRYR